MSFIFKIEVVARGQGRVIPTDRVQVIQPEYSGRIEAIHVRDGSRVEKGDILVELDPTDAMAELQTITEERDRLIIENARIDALLALLTGGTQQSATPEEIQSAFAVPSSLLESIFLIRQRMLLGAEVTDIQAALAQIDARENALRKSEDVTKANIDRVESALKTQAERLSISERLLQRGTTSRTSFLDVQQGFTDLERERDVYLRQLEQKVSERSALDSERRRVLADTRSTRLNRKSAIDARLASLSEAEHAARNRVEATILRAPLTGTVDQLQVYTLGGIAEAGAELMHIVPDSSSMDFEALFSNQDIGFMAIGQKANISLDAYPSERFGLVLGHVADLAADSTEISDGNWGYVVRIVPDNGYIQIGEKSLPLRPGMTGTIDVTTENRRIISYFFAPILRTIEDALGER
jgi:hemolysin D